MKYAAIGMVMALTGFVSIALQIIGYELVILEEINSLGFIGAWLVRLGLLIGGGFLWLKYKDEEGGPDSTTYFD